MRGTMAEVEVPRSSMPLAPEELEVPDPEALYGPIAEAPSDLEEKDMLALLSAMISASGLIGYSLNSFNQFVERGISKIMTEMFKIDFPTKNMNENNEGIDHFRVQIDFTSAEVGRPSRAQYPSGQTEPQWPNHARNTKCTYAAPFSMSAEIRVTAYHTGGAEETKTATVDKFEVSQLPIMVGSSACHTHNLTREARKQMQEDPREQGGYFIVGGGEWGVEMLENVRFNSLHVYLRVKEKEKVRGEYISQPGGAFENSSQVIVRHLVNNQIMVETNSMKFQNAQIPFYLIFRLFGMTSDLDIISQIVDPNSQSPVDQAIVDIVDEALHLAPAEPILAELKDELDRQVISERLGVVLERFVSNPTSYRTEENAVRFLTTSVLSVMDKVFLPHVGQTPADRTAKLRFLGRIIYKTLLTELGVTPPTDRDSFEMKRVHGAGESLAKAFKAMVNRAVVSPVIGAIKRELQQTLWAKITPVRLMEAGRTMFTMSNDLKRLFARCITSGNEIIMVRRRAMMNRVSSNALERKSPLNLVSSLRRVTAHNAGVATKGTERAELIRSVHPLSMGYICPYHSADTGEKVGLEKQLACTTDVCDAGDIQSLVARLRADPEIIPLVAVSNLEISKRNLAPVYANGAWIGSCERPDRLVARYRGLRRRGIVISPFTTICWKIVTNEVEFWLDVGRITRPLLIVDNNQAEFDEACRKAHAAKERGDEDWEKHRVDFVQNVRYTKKHVAEIMAGRLSLEDLVIEGVVEYVAPEEMANCLLSPTIKHLYENRTNYLYPYTHCDIPQALSGLAALVSPFANHTQPARVTYETNQGRQTCGWYCLSWPYRADQQRFFQFYCQRPLIQTMCQQYVMASGMNVRIAYSPWRGNNQEDSAIVSQDACHLGLFAGLFFRKQEVVLQKGERFATPDASNTRGMKRQAVYGKLGPGGFVPPGTLVRKGDVLVGRVAKDTRAADRKMPAQGRGAAAAYEWVDKSVVYTMDEPARVNSVWLTNGEEDETVIIISLRYFEPVNIGDKMSSRSGNKSITAMALPHCDLPYDEEGLRPDIFINPHSIPTRMVIGQMIESLLGRVHARSGTIGDGTMFRDFDSSKLPEMLAKVGLRESCHSTMYNPRTGMPLDVAIFVGNVFQQRLQKFIDFITFAAPHTGPTDALTGQPLEGKRQGGGLRWGEMEGWVMAGHGAMATYGEKIRRDADGRPFYLCRGCGGQADFNVEYSIYNCVNCGERADIVMVPNRQACIVFMQEMLSSGVQMTMETLPPRFENYHQ